MGTETITSFDSSQYNNPQSTEVEIDTVTGELQKEKVISPWAKILAASALYDITVQDPDENCKKCGGRGYTSIDAETQMPIGCDCIFPKTPQEELEAQTGLKLTRGERRKLNRKLKKQEMRNRKKGIHGGS